MQSDSIENQIGFTPTGFIPRLYYWMQIFLLSPKQISVESGIPIGRIKTILSGSQPSKGEAEAILRVLWGKAEDFLESMVNELTAEQLPAEQLENSV